MASSTSVSDTVVCRCCLQGRESLICIFKEVNDIISLSYAAIVKNCFDLQITVGDGLPDKICGECSKEAERVYNFKKMCLSSEEHLRPSATFKLERNKEVACQTEEFHAFTEKDVDISSPEKNLVEVEPQSVEDKNHLTKPMQNDVIAKGSGEGSVSCSNQEGEKGKESNILEETEKSGCAGVCDDILSSIPDKDGGNSATNTIDGEGPKFPLHVETQVGVEAEDILENSLDFPFVAEISPTEQDPEKDKDGDIVEGNALKDIISSLDSPVTEGDITDWLGGDGGPKDSSATSARNLSQPLEGGKENSEESDIPCRSKDDDHGKDLVENVKELNTDKTPDKHSPTKGTADEEKAEEDQELGEGCEKDVAREHENQKRLEEDALPSSPIIGKLTIKPLEDLTCNINQATHSAEPLLTSDNVSAKESESTIDTRDELSLTNLLKKSDLKNGGSNSVDLAGDVSENDHCLKERTLGQIITYSLDKDGGDNPPGGESSEISVGAELGDGSGPDLGDDNCSDNFTSENRKRSWKDVGEKGAAEDVSKVDPLCKKLCSVENSIGEKEDSSKEMGDVGGDPLPSNEVSDGEKEKTADAGTDITGEEDESNNQAEVAMEAEDNNFSDDDDIMRDNDSVSNSSGSEYIPVDSPTGSDESPRPRRRSSRPTEKVEVRNLRKQGYHIRECRVVLSDIAHSGSGANSLSSHLSVSSLKSLENDSEITKVDKKDLRSETDDISDNASSCTAWIKVEPEDMKELEEEHDNEDMQEDEEGAPIEDNQLWNAASNDANAEQMPRSSDGTQPVLAKVLPGRKLFRCPFCAKGFRTRNQMIVHRGLHTGDLPYPCEVCGKRFALRCRLLRHMSVHDSSIVCEFCGMDFKTNILLGRHIKSKHTIPSYTYNPSQGVPPPLATPPPQEPAPLPTPPAKGSVQRFPCRLCPRVFSSMNGLKGHKRVHVSKNAPSRQSISSHVEQKSSNENTCKICGMSFPSPLYLKSHMVCHTIIRPNSGKVNLIEASGADESQRMGMGSDAGLQEEGMNLMEPTVLIHESSYALQNQSGGMRQYICTVCSQIFQSQAKLMRHQVLTHHNQQSFKCDMCPSTLANAVQLQNHKLSVHSAPVAVKKEHKCKVCGKVFSKSSRLNQHMNYHLTVEPVSCKVCGEYFENAEHLDYHTKTIHETVQNLHVGGGLSGTNDLTCSVCRRVFSKRSRLKRHMMLHETQSFPCSKCSKAFISEELLAEHLISHEQNPSQSPSASVSPAVSQSPVAEEGVTCTACGRSFANKTRLKQHVVMHTKSGFVACQNCLKVFANRQVLESHAQTCSNSDEQHSPSQSSTNFKSASLPHMSGFSSCTNCGKAFPSKGLLTEHEKTCVGVTVVKKQDGTWKVLETDDRTRAGNGGGSSIMSPSKLTPTTSPSGDSKSHVCKFCGKRFNNYHGLNSHMRFHQDTTGVFKCDLCDKTFPSRNKLSQHMSSHSAVYRCGICSQAFGLVEELKKHVSQCMSAQSGITPNYFFCNGCSEAFNLLEELAEHVTCHANEFPHICNVCYKVFEHPSQLSRHMATHGKVESGGRHTCKVCQKAFSNAACLEKHSVVHTGEKKFECSYCFQRFSQKSSLNRHQLTQHETKQ